MSGARPLAYAHIGDLHLTRAGEQNYLDLLSIAAQLETECCETLDFVLLPGDNADHGLPSQYRLAATALRLLSVPVHILAGDHDMEQGGLDAFRAHLAAEPLPRSVAGHGHRCLLLDVCGPGTGGPDFRLGEEQLRWAEGELQAAQAADETAIVFMHCFPSDLQGAGEAERVVGLCDRYGVALVDTGHTHYNHLANDGRTIYAATRSTGQIDEGPVGYSLVTVDHGAVSWRFRALEDPFPTVMITAPADRRLVRDAGQQLAGGASCDVRAMVFGGEAVASVACRWEDGEWIAMQRDPDGRLWSARVAVPEAPRPSLTVRALTPEGRPGQHTIEPATTATALPAPQAGAGDKASVGAWPENGILGTELGPNSNGRHW